MSESKSSLISGNTLFLDSVIGALTGYVFWILASRLIIPIQIGYAGSFLSVTTIWGTIFGFGLDYTILRDIQSDSTIAGKAFVVEMLASVPVIPVLFLYGWFLTGSLFSIIALVAIFYTFVQSLGFVVKASLLGLREFRLFVLVHAVGYAARVPVLLILVVYSSSTLSIFLALLSMLLIPSVVMAYYLFRSVGITRFSLRQCWSLMISSVPNVSAEVGSVLLSNFGVVLYVLLTHDITGSGIFYIILIATSVISNFGSSLATSSLAFADKRDSKNIFAETGRVGLALTIPFLVLLAVDPSMLLALFNVRIDYVPFLLILLAQIPTIVLSVEYSRLIRQVDVRKLISVSSVQILILSLLFPILATSLHLEGAAIAIFVSTSMGAVTAVILSRSWSGYRFLQSFGGLIMGFLPCLILGHSVFIAIFGALISTVIMMSLGSLKKSDFAIIPSSINYILRGKFEK